MPPAQTRPKRPCRPATGTTRPLRTARAARATPPGLPGRRREEQIDPWPRSQRGQPLQQFEGIEDEIVVPSDQRCRRSSTIRPSDVSRSRSCATGGRSV